MKYLLTIFIYLFAVGCSNAFPSKHDAEVLYWHEFKDGQHYYYYNVVNNSSSSNIVHISVGYKYDDNYGEPQLFAPAKDRTHIPLEFISPEGWNGKIEYVEESLNYSLGWRTSAGAKFNIPPNSSSYQFGVVLDNERRLMLTGGRDKLINIWNLEMLKNYTTGNKNHPASYQPIEFSEDESIRDASFVGDKWILVTYSTEGLTSGKGGTSLLPLDFDLTGVELQKHIK